MESMKIMKKYFMFQLELKNKKTYFSDFPCVPWLMFVFKN